MIPLHDYEGRELWIDVDIFMTSLDKAMRGCHSHGQPFEIPFCCERGPALKLVIRPEVKSPEIHYAGDYTLAVAQDVATYVRILFGEPLAAALLDVLAPKATDYTQDTRP